MKRNPFPRFWIVWLLLTANRTGAEPPGQATSIDLRHLAGVTLLDGRTFQAQATEGVQATVFLFLSTDCPISNGYAPELHRIQEEFEPRGIRFWTVFCDPAESRETISHHLREYVLPLNALLDPHQKLAHALGAQMTPEVAVLGPDDQCRYRGRIDDRHVRLGESRPEATQHDLRNALVSILEHRPIAVPVTRAIGCHLPSNP